MEKRLGILLGQLNPTVGDLAGNAARAVEFYAQAVTKGLEFALLPEMFLSGYQVQDLVMKPSFEADCASALAELAAGITDDTVLGIGAPVRVDGALYNGYFYISQGKIQSRILKHHLPNFNVFDEKRHYASGALHGPSSLHGVRLGTLICEDGWHQDYAETLKETGAELIFSANGSPYFRDKMDLRMNVFVARGIETGLPLIYLNLVGGQDDQVFDGGSFVLNPGGELALQLPQFEDAIAEIYATYDGTEWRVEQGALASLPSSYEADYHAMVLGTRDYFKKTGFKKCLLGLSGGVDSALVATIACDALGAENVRCVMLPSEYTSQGSLDDAKACAENLGVKLDTIAIGSARHAVTETLAPLFEGTKPDLTEENIQSRLRGVYLMALSNKFGEMLLTTGNKSEVAVGYATIYGDMAGGYNPIKDLYKMRVFETCRWRNANHRDWMLGADGVVIPETIINKPPSAELRPDQKDEDSLPPYEVLDEILETLVDKDGSVADLVKRGFDEDVVRKIERLVYLSEYKRFQSAPGVRLTPRAFWLDRRYPIVNHWRSPQSNR